MPETVNALGERTRRVLLCLLFVGAHAHGSDKRHDDRSSKKVFILFDRRHQFLNEILNISVGDLGSFCVAFHLFSRRPFCERALEVMGPAGRLFPWGRSDPCPTRFGAGRSCRTGVPQWHVDSTVREVLR